MYALTRLGMPPAAMQVIIANTVNPSLPVPDSPVPAQSGKKSLGMKEHYVSRSLI